MFYTELNVQSLGSLVIEVAVGLFCTQLVREHWQVSAGNGTAWWQRHVSDIWSATDIGGDLERPCRLCLARAAAGQTQEAGTSRELTFNFTKRLIKLNYQVMCISCKAVQVRRNHWTLCKSLQYSVCVCIMMLLWYFMAHCRCLCGIPLWSHYDVSTLSKLKFCHHKCIKLSFFWL